MHLEVRHLLRLTPVLLIAAAAIWWSLTRPGPDDPAASEGGSSPGRAASDSRAESFAGSSTCRPCHESAWRAWSRSHHASAELSFDPSRHGEAFTPDRRVAHGTQVSHIRRRGVRCEVLARGTDGQIAPFLPARIIGVDPLWQPVVSMPGGRFQVTELAFDPHADEWFNVYGDEDRRPDEWGFWANRGMNWNSMCGSCHTTAFEKRWSETNDTYDSRWLELGAGCESCHGPRADHVAAQSAAGVVADASVPLKISWPPAAFGPGSQLQPGTPLSSGMNDGGLVHAVAPGAADLEQETCGACHARRVDLTGEFRPGERFLDHFRPVIPDDTEVYYPDGQVHEEDFEYVSFLSSKMFSLGVRCVHCHEPHSGELRAQGNDLCLGCHAGSIDVARHSRHDASGEGARCVNCHMPQTNYMQRHRRHDHGFTIPDPLLTREHGIPNACSRCHDDRSVDWAIENAERLFGERLVRPTRARARAVAKGRARREEAVEALLAVDAQDPSALWRSVALGLLGHWTPTRGDVVERLLERCGDPDALVRATAARSLEPLAARDPRVASTLTQKLEDSVRAVRIEAAWALRRSLAENSSVFEELTRYLAYNSDQPTGALQRGLFELDRDRPGGLERAFHWLARATSWDANSPFLWQSLAIAESRLERPRDAVASLERAVALAPGDAGIIFSLALALAELGDLPGARARLERVVEIDATFTRAWYNLALASNELGDSQGAIDAIRRAEALEPRSVDYIFTRATLLETAGELRDAVLALEEADAVIRDELRAATGRALVDESTLRQTALMLVDYRIALLERLGDEPAIDRARRLRETRLGELRPLTPAP